VPAAKKPSKKETEALEAQVPILYGIREDLLQATINMLAELPYKTVGDLLNQVRGCKPVEVKSDTK